MPTFDPTVPQNSDSPSIFPAQNQANMLVMNAILARDHQFNNTPNAIPPTDNSGYHNLIHMTQQAPSGALASTGRLYVKTISGLIQLFYMDDAGNNYQVTPLSNAPTKTTGSVALAANATSGNIYTPPANTQGTILVAYTAPTTSGIQLLFAYYVFVRVNSTNITLKLVENNVNLTTFPEVVVSTSNLRVKNNYAVSNVPTAATVGYWINAVSF